MNTEEHDDLWSLLGKAKTPHASPFFSRNILRVIREEQPGKVGALGWLQRHWRLALGAVSASCAVGIAILAFVPRPDPLDPATLRLAEQVSESSDYQVITDLDELLASVENSVWLEN